MTKEEVRKKLDDKIKELNSTRVFKKITPKGDLSWYIKWISSIFIIIGMGLSMVGISTALHSTHIMLGVLIFVSGFVITFSSFKPTHN